MVKGVARGTLTQRRLGWRQVLCLALAPILLILGWIVLGRSAGITLLIWEQEPSALPIWWTVNPQAPRLPLPEAIDALATPEAKGRAFHATINQFSVTLPESQASLRDLNWRWMMFNPLPLTDISIVARHYIPAGTSYVDAERTLEAAGLKIAIRRVPDSERPVLPGSKVLFPWPKDGFEETAELNQFTTDPPGYLRLGMSILPQTPGAYDDMSPVGKIVALFNKQLGPPRPAVSFPFKVSEAFETLDVPIRVDEVTKRFFFNLVFRSAKPSDIKRVSKLAGGSGRYNDGRYGEPGVIVPLSLTILRPDGSIFFENTFQVQGSGSFGYMWIFRNIVAITFPPGEYRVKVRTLAPNPLLLDVDTELGINNSF